MNFSNQRETNIETRRKRSSLKDIKTQQNEIINQSKEQEQEQEE